MNVNELMIGDIVRRKKDGVILYVEEIIYSGTLMAICPTDMYYSDAEDYNEYEIEPIPLTPEILEKNGFVKSEVINGFNEYDWLKGESLIAIAIGEIEVMWIRRTPAEKAYSLPYPKYVHELQHALRLCKIDKEIELKENK